MNSIQKIRLEVEKLQKEHQQAAEQQAESCKGTAYMREIYFSEAYTKVLEIIDVHTGEIEELHCELCGETDPANCPHYGNFENEPQTVAEEKTEMCETCEQMWEKSYICLPCSNAKQTEICLNCCRHAVEIGGGKNAV